MATTVDLRKRSTLKVLNALAVGGTMTKNELSEKTNLTLVTVNKIINQLNLMGVVSEDGIADSNWGRKAGLYRLKQKACLLCGISVEIGVYNIEIVDLNLTLVGVQSGRFDVSQTFEKSWARITDTVRNVARTVGVPMEGLLGIGITVPGVVDSESGTLRFMTNLNTWNNIPLKEIAEKEFKLPVFVEKDNYAAMLYLKSHSEYRLKNAVSIVIKGGIGCGLLFNGIILHGENGFAGEFGHIPIEPDGPLCSCGSHGCLELYASDIAIISAVTAGIAAGTKSSLNGTDAKKAANPDIEDIITAANAGDALCRSAIENAGHYLGIAINGIVKAYDPPYVFIDCTWMRKVDGLLDRVVAVFKMANTMPGNANTSIICIKEEDFIFKGAAMLVFDHYMNHTTNNRLLEKG